MKVLHVTTSYPTINVPQKGIFIYSQIQSLNEQGIQADVIVIKGRGILKYLQGIFELKSKLKNNNYSLIHAHYMYVGWIAKLASELPLIISFMGNDVFGDVSGENKYKFASKFLHRFLSNILLSRSSFGIVKSNSLAMEFKNKTKVEIIPNGVNMNIFFPRSDIKKPDLGLSDTCRYILFAGTPERKEKRYELAWKAFKKLKDKIPDTELIYLQKKSPQEVALYLNTCDCLLLTSVHEGSPNIVKEALACNLPVVSVSVGDVSEQISGISNCYIANANPDDLAEKLYKVLSQSDKAKGGCEKMKSISLENIAVRIINVYNHILQLNTK